MISKSISYILGQVPLDISHKQRAELTKDSFTVTAICRLMLQGKEF